MLKDLIEKREDRTEQRHKEKRTTANSLTEFWKELAKNEISQAGVYFNYLCTTQSSFNEQYPYLQHN